MLLNTQALSYDGMDYSNQAQKWTAWKIIKKFLNLVKEIVLGNRLGKFPVPGQPQAFESFIKKRKIN